MSKTESKLSVYEKLNKIQTELKVSKSQYNKYGDFYYRSLEDIQKALKPLLEKYKAIVLLEDKIKEINGRFYVEAEAKFIDIETENIISVFASAREQEYRKGMDQSQITGSASSYARKYAMNGLFAIDDTKDADFFKNTNNLKQNKSELKKLRQEVFKLSEIKGQTAAMPNLIKTRYKKEKSSELNMEELKELKSYLSKI